MTGNAQQIKELARNIGFDLVGIAGVKHYPEMNVFRTWLDAGYAGEMDYLHKIEPRINPERLLPGAKSIISCGCLYDTDKRRSIEATDRQRAWISRYAWNVDYHFVLSKMLDRLVELIKTELGLSFAYRRYVDTGPLLERVLAHHAGLGWFGKNSCLIHPKLGSYFFIGEIITDLSLDPDNPVPDYCGSCTRCIDACPTGAIVEDGVIDSRKCISYQTIENKSTIPEDIREGIGHHFFGCDICQEVCPWNSKSPLSQHSEFRPKEQMFYPELEGLGSRIVDEYPEAFRKSPLKRPKQRGLLRNFLVVAGNSNDPEMIPILEEIEVERDEMLSELKAWAIKKLKSSAHHRVKTSVSD